MIFSFHCNISLVSNRISFCVFFEIEISHNQSMIIFHPTPPSNVVNCQCFYANLQNNIEGGGGEGTGKGLPSKCAWVCRYQNDLSSQEEAPLALKCLNLIIQIFLIRRRQNLNNPAWCSILYLAILEMCPWRLAGDLMTVFDLKIKDFKLKQKWTHQKQLS